MHNHHNHHGRDARQCVCATISFVLSPPSLIFTLCRLIFTLYRLIFTLCRLSARPDQSHAQAMRMWKSQMHPLEEGFQTIAKVCVCVSREEWVLSGMLQRCVVFAKVG